MSTPAPRFESFSAFWPYYLGEHRVPLCRRLHFVGTTLFLCVMLVSFVGAPLRVLAAIALCSVAVYAMRGMDAERSSAPVLLGVIVIMALANPLILTGVFFAYFFAWAAHFMVEHNRPATFTYPMWSLAGDFRMYGRMWRGQLWDGDPTGATAA